MSVMDLDPGNSIIKAKIHISHNIQIRNTSPENNSIEPLPYQRAALFVGESKSIII